MSQSILKTSNAFFGLRTPARRADTASQLKSMHATYIDCRQTLVLIFRRMHNNIMLCLQTVAIRMKGDVLHPLQFDSEK